MPFDHAIEDHAELRSRYRQPHPAVVAKVIDHVDEGAAGFIARSPFFVLASAGGGSTDTSPRGGPPGFVQVLDEQRLVFGDLVGNNRIDSFTHIVDHPAVSLLFIIPGLSETLRVAGRATLTTDPELLDRTTVDGRRPNVAVGIDVERCFVHCAKAFLRSKLWEPESWPGAEQQPDVMEIFLEHADIRLTPEQIAAAAAEVPVLWDAGGEPTPI